ncbi:MAG TPA: hypothetical protein VF515_16615 [Candidatus Binatia bacterium]
MVNVRSPSGVPPEGVVAVALALGVGVFTSAAVEDGVAVGVEVLPGTGVVGVALGGVTGVAVGGALVGVLVGAVGAVGGGVFVGVDVTATGVSVAIGVTAAVSVGTAVLVAIGVFVGVPMYVGVAVDTRVWVASGLAVRLGVGARVADGRGVSAGAPGIGYSTMSMVEPPQPAVTATSNRTEASRILVLSICHAMVFHILVFIRRLRVASPMVIRQQDTATRTEAASDIMVRNQATRSTRYSWPSRVCVMNVGNLETRGREKGSTTSSYCRFQAISIAWVLAVPHTPKALRITAQGCRSSGYPG